MEQLPADERALLQVLAELGATVDARHRRRDVVVRAWCKRSGGSFDDGYDVLCSLVQPWQLRLPLVDGHGNFGTPLGDRAGVPTATACRLGPIGAQLVESRTGATPAPPVSIVNGTWHRGGTAPPCNPHRIAAALLVLQDRPADDDELVALVGAPVTPTGSVVTGEADALLRGRAGRLRLTASFAIASRDGKAILRVTNFPLPRTATAAGNALNQGMRDERDLSRFEGLIDFQQRNDTLFCFIKPTEQAEVIAARLRSHPAFLVDVDARLPAPMPLLLRDWTTTGGGAAARETLEKLAS